MATKNPMQRKARNSFLLGMLLTLILAGIVIGFLVYQLILMKQEEEAAELAQISVYTLNTDVESGDEITLADLSLVTVDSSTAPTDYIPTSIFTNDEGEEVTVTAKISMTKGTIVSTEMVNVDGEAITDDVRTQEYNMLVLPSDLTDGDYIDIRLQIPDGPDYIVVSKKQVTIPSLGGEMSTDTIQIEMHEDEILTMSSAIVDAFMINGAKLYVTKYVEPGNQEAATVTYPENSAVLALMEADENILEEAMTALYNRYNETLVNQRNNVINAEISNDEDSLDNYIENMEESITNSATTREEYLEGLTVVTTTTSTDTTNTTN